MPFTFPCSPSLPPALKIISSFSLSSRGRRRASMSRDSFDRLGRARCGTNGLLRLRAPAGGGTRRRPSLDRGNLSSARRTTDGRGRDGLREGNMMSRDVLRLYRVVSATTERRKSGSVCRHQRGPAESLCRPKSYRRSSFRVSLRPRNVLRVTSKGGSALPSPG